MVIVQEIFGAHVIDRIGDRRIQAGHQLLQRIGREPGR